MFDKFLISKNELSKFKITQKNPFDMTCEKVTQTPRIFNTTQIKAAIENVLITKSDEVTTPELTLKITEYILKDLFLSMHQSGLYNRQLKLWEIIGNVKQGSIFKLNKGLIKKKELDIYIIDFFIDPQSPCFSVVFNNDTEVNNNTSSLLKNLNTYILRTLMGTKADRFKGIFYLLNTMPEKGFHIGLDQMTNAFDPISRYESRITFTKDVRLNVITSKKENNGYTFEHIYPEVKLSKIQEVKV